VNFFKRNTPELANPVNLERDASGQFDWTATTADAQFTILNVQDLKANWVRLNMVLNSESAVVTPVVVYEDFGSGFSEASAHYLMADAEGHIDFTWYLPVTLKALRLDPVAHVVRFSILKFELQPTSRTGLVWRSAWRVLTRYPGGLKNKFVSGIRLYRRSGLRATLARLVAVNKELSRNPALGLANGDEELARQRLADPNRISVVESYIQSGFARSNSNVTWQSNFVPKAPDPLLLENLTVKIVAFYLPQFHPFAENDSWWGKGFTEWTNVTKAQPQYLGHHQPHLPGELGFYDLRLPEVMRQQIELAQHYGVTGFCFHHYWFGGKRLMERPVNQLLADLTFNIDFCLCWANENWTRRWDGLDNDVLISQNHSPEDDLAFLEDILPALKDSRYIRVDGKPFLIVYRADLLPDAAATAARWREQANKAGLPGLYLVAARTWGITDPRPYGFDATVEFPPHQVPASEVTHKKTVVNPAFEGKIYDYKDFAYRFGNIEELSFTNYKTVMPSWDNEARKPGKGFIFDGAEPSVYAQWLTDAVTLTQKNKPSERLLFVNAWNEWAEGAHLEPDRHLGYAYLHATANVLRNLCQIDIASELSNLNLTFLKQHDSVIILHLYYEDLIDLIFLKYLVSIQGFADLIVTVRPDIDVASLTRIKAIFSNVFFIRTDNRGRDIRPFLQALQLANDLQYKYICKLHTKKSLHRADGGQWRDELFDRLIRSPAHVEKAIGRLQADQQLGLLAPLGCMTNLSDEPINIGNRKWLHQLFKRLNVVELSNSYDTQFPAGSMYWARVAALVHLLDQNVFNLNEFELEAGQLDGTLAHSVERVIGLVVKTSGFSIEHLS
jgi:lipopolysaccharide biosynthesis protein